MGLIVKHLAGVLGFVVSFACADGIQTFSQPSSQSLITPATVVLIVDDLGHNLAVGKRAIQLPGAINYSILPQSPNGAALARAAYQQGKEVMLHMPMSNIRGRQMAPGVLKPAMDQQQFIEAVRNHLDSVPHVRGVNNHMGSLLTQLHQPMSWFIKELKQRQLYFVDSRTSPLTVAESVARTHNLPHLRRHIFLDNQRDQQAIAAQFEKLLILAKNRGTAVAIAHPHPETLSFLEQALPSISTRGVRLAFASEAVTPPTRQCVTNNPDSALTNKNCLKI